MFLLLLLLLPTVAQAECCPYPAIPWSVKDAVPSFMDYSCEDTLQLICPARYDHKAAVLGDYNKTRVVNVLAQSVTDHWVSYTALCVWQHGWSANDLVLTMTGPFYTDFTCAYTYRNENKWRVVGYDGYQ